MKKMICFTVMVAVAILLGGCDQFKKFTDKRDDKTYKVVKIGRKVWMAQNLDYEVLSSQCYANNLENCEKYGRLYTWDVALSICPDGWHLPTKEDFDELLEAVGGKDKAGLALKSTDEWEKGGAGKDSFLFSVLPSGYYDGYTEAFVLMGTNAYFWAASSINMRYAYALRMNANAEDAYIDGNYEYDAIPVRCVRN